MTAAFPTSRHADGEVTVYGGDCVAVLRAGAVLGYDFDLGYEPARLIPDGSIDAVVTDPPYELTSGKKGGTGASINLNSPHGRSRIGTGNGGGGFMGKQWDATGIAHSVEIWAECLRILKPGGHLLAFGGTRTYHRLGCAIEDAGFEIRDSIAWLSGQGFPKSLDVSEAIDKAAGAERCVVGTRRGGAALNVNGDNPRPWHERQAARGGEYDVTAPTTDAAKRWHGWGTALKPAFEPIVVGRKPLSGTVAANVQQHGTGALNIDACRVASEPLVTFDRVPGDRSREDYRTGTGVNRRVEQTAGRWPTNVVLDDSQAAELDRQTGVLTSGANPSPRGSDKFRNAYGEFKGQAECTPARGADSGGASRFFPTFRYEAKAPGSERPKGEDGSAHPTVKPLDLMRWLVRLVTPPGGTVLDPFAGSGTTAEACLLEGFRCVAVERDPEYLRLIAGRLAKPMQSALFP